MTEVATHLDLYNTKRQYRFKIVWKSNIILVQSDTVNYYSYIVFLQASVSCDRNYFFRQLRGTVKFNYSKCALLHCLAATNTYF